MERGDDGLPSVALFHKVPVQKTLQRTLESCFQQAVSGRSAQDNHALTRRTKPLRERINKRTLYEKEYYRLMTKYIQFANENLKHFRNNGLCRAKGGQLLRETSCNGQMRLSKPYLPSDRKMRDMMIPL